MKKNFKSIPPSPSSMSETRFEICDGTHTARIPTNPRYLYEAAWCNNMQSQQRRHACSITLQGNFAGQYSQKTLHFGRPVFNRQSENVQIFYICVSYTFTPLNFALFVRQYSYQGHFVRQYSQRFWLVFFFCMAVLSLGRHSHQAAPSTK